MPQYELVLEIAPLTEDAEDALMSELDCTIGGHGNTSLLTVTAQGPTAESALRHLVHGLDAHGITVRRMVEDLVDRKAIAMRAGVTRQAAGLWIRGDRHQHTAFPEPYTLASGGLWLWGEVAAWLTAADRLDDDMNYPTREDHVRCNHWLLDTQTRNTSSVDAQASPIDVIFSGIPMTPGLGHPWMTLSHSWTPMNAAPRATVTTASQVLA